MHQATIALCFLSTQYLYTILVLTIAKVRWTQILGARPALKTKKPDFIHAEKTDGEKWTPLDPP